MCSLIWHVPYHSQMHSTHFLCNLATEPLYKLILISLLIYNFLHSPKQGVVTPLPNLPGRIMDCGSRTRHWSKQLVAGSWQLWQRLLVVCEKSIFGARERMLWLRALTFLLEDLSFVHSTHFTCLTTACNFNPGDSTPLNPKATCVYTTPHTDLYTYT